MFVRIFVELQSLFSKRQLRQGNARRGEVGFGVAWQRVAVPAWFGKGRHGAARRGGARSGRYGGAGSGSAGRGQAGRGKARQFWRGLARRGLAWWGQVRQGS